MSALAQNAVAVAFGRRLVLPSYDCKPTSTSQRIRLVYAPSSSSGQNSVSTVIIGGVPAIATPQMMLPHVVAHISLLGLAYSLPRDLGIRNLLAHYSLSRNTSLDLAGEMALQHA
ncbi:hypothetical protein EDC04DRAFT_2907897 [Pisolithus marmoratus]|nr:hypothetical protein EDC04DRAFT_2907897 [Pisolithus marmoratus]